MFVRNAGSVLVLVSALSAVWTSASARAQEPSVTFKSSVELVPISAVVRDGHGRLVTSLRASDFQILDKGEPRRIVDFQIDGTTPVTVAVLVDVSGSMRVGPKQALAREVVSRLTASLDEGRDQVGLFTFDVTLHQKRPFAPVTPSLEHALDDEAPFGTTSLYDAIAETARQLQQHPSARRGIVVITDGLDTSSAMTPPEVSAVASAIDVPVYVVVTGQPIDQTQHESREAARTSDAQADLRELSLWTGGDLLWLTTQADAMLRARQIVTSLRHQYLIAIESAAQPEWRPLEVRVRDRHLTVRARSGYFSRDQR